MTPDTRQAAELDRRTERPEGWLTIGSLVAEVGVTKATIHHYVAMGLIPAPVKVNRQMAYYDPACIERILTIKDLQHRRFLPLAVIKQVLDRYGPDDLKHVDESVLEEGRGGKRWSRSDLLAAYAIDDSALSDLVAAGVLAPENGEFSEDDAEIVSYAAQMRAAGLDEHVGFSPGDLAAYVRAADALIDEEFEIFNTRVLANAGPDEAARLARAAAKFGPALFAALHRRKLTHRLESIRGSGS